MARSPNENIQGLQVQFRRIAPIQAALDELKPVVARLSDWAAASREQ